MSLQELETAVRHEVPIVVLGNDSSLSSEYHYLDVQGGPAGIARLCLHRRSPTSLCAEGHTATSLEDVDAVADHLHAPDGPVVLECIVDHEFRHHSD